MPARTATFTVSGEEAVPAESVTVRENARLLSARTCGAVNVGAAALAELRVTVGPAVWLHE